MRRTPIKTNIFIKVWWVFFFNFIPQFIWIRMRYTELSFWVGVEEQLNTVTRWHYTHQCCRALDSGSKEIKVFICVSPIMARFHPSPNLCLASLRFPFTTAPLCRCKLLFVSALWRSENYSANVQRETISAVCLPVFVCLCVCLCGCGYRCKRSRRSRPLQNKLINWPFVRAETDPMRHEDKKENTQINVGEENLGRNSKLKERRSLSGLNDYLTSIDHIVWSWQHTCARRRMHTQTRRITHSRMLPINTNDMHMILHRMEVMVPITSSDSFTACYCQMNYDNWLPSVSHHVPSVHSFSSASWASIMWQVRNDQMNLNRYFKLQQVRLKKWCCEWLDSLNCRGQNSGFA